MSDKRDRNLNFYFSTLDTNSISASCTRLLKFTPIQATSIEIVRKQYFYRTPTETKAAETFVKQVNHVGQTMSDAQKFH